MTQQLSALRWHQIANLWAELGEFSSIEVDLAQQHAAEGLLSLVGGSNVMMVIQRRLGPRSSALNGFRAVYSHDMGPDLQRRRDILIDWNVNEPFLDRDPVLRQATADAGSPRVILHRADTSAAAWDRAPVRRLLEESNVEDRADAVVPVSPEVEVSFCIDRPRGNGIFDEQDRALLQAVTRGLRPLATNFVQLHGHLPGQSELTPVEKRVLGLLLSAHTDAEIARATDMERARFQSIAQRIYRKEGVDDRVGLMNLWLRGKGRRRADCEANDVDEGRIHPRLPVEAPSLRRRVHAALVEAMDADDFHIDAVARRLGMSARTLQRRLSAQDMTFRDLSDEVRREHAERMLARPDLSFTAIALKLGYTQASSFNRAVRRWTGLTPSQLRTRLLSDEAGQDGL